MIKYLLISIVALIYGIWWWRKNYQPSVLEKHYNDLDAKQKIGNLSQLAFYASIPVNSMFAQGWGTTAIVNPTNLSYNRPGKTILNLRWAQPTQL